MRKVTLDKLSDNVNHTFTLQSHKIKRTSHKLQLIFRNLTTIRPEWVSPLSPWKSGRRLARIEEFHSILLGVIGIFRTIFAASVAAYRSLHFLFRYLRAIVPRRGFLRGFSSGEIIKGPLALMRVRSSEIRKTRIVSVSPQAGPEIPRTTAMFWSGRFARQKDALGRKTRLTIGTRIIAKSPRRRKSRKFKGSFKIALVLALVVKVYR